MKTLILFLVITAAVTFGAQSGDLIKTVQRLVDNGEFKAAQKLMRQHIAENPEMNAQDLLWMEFEIKRLQRIRKDFDKTGQQVLEQIRKIIPTATKADMRRWEKERALECMTIDGEKKYFKYAVNNLFRINSRLKAIKAEKRPVSSKTGYDRLLDLRAIIQQSAKTQKRFVNPVRAKITYTLTVPANTVPAGEVLRCWLPFPRRVPNRQTDIKILHTQPDSYTLSGAEHAHKTIYFEKAARSDRETVFQVGFSFQSYAAYTAVKADRVDAVDPDGDLKPFLSERPPHIVFTPELRTLSQKIVNDEKNPYYIAQKIFKWIDDNIPWASAREYSTFENISDYVYTNRHADCGMQTIFFMTLCRMNGIPTRWQSGWFFQPTDWTMHDWGEIYFEPYGWVPVDVTYGLQKSDRFEEKWFFLSGMDAFRLIVNSDYSGRFYPAKIHERSETIDFQRGEVEWRGGNLYFDQWAYDFKVKLLD